MRNFILSIIRVVPKFQASRFSEETMKTVIDLAKQVVTIEGDGPELHLKSSGRHSARSPRISQLPLCRWPRRPFRLPVITDCLLRRQKRPNSCIGKSDTCAVYRALLLSLGNASERIAAIAYYQTKHAARPICVPEGNGRMAYTLRSSKAEVDGCCASSDSKRKYGYMGESWAWGLEDQSERRKSRRLES